MDQRGCPLRDRPRFWTCSSGCSLRSSSDADERRRNREAGEGLPSTNRIRLQLSLCADQHTQCHESCIPSALQSSLATITASAKWTRGDREDVVWRSHPSFQISDRQRSPEEAFGNCPRLGPRELETPAINLPKLRDNVVRTS